MKKNDLRNKMQSGFLEAAPDVYEAVLKTTEKNKLMLQDKESHKADESVIGVATGDFYRNHAESRKGNVFWGNFSKYALSACAGFALFFLCLFGMLGKNQDDIYIVMDINPSVQIVMNKSCQVKKLKGLNQDGKNIIQTLDWKRKDSLFQTVDALLQSSVEKTYLHEGCGILVTISAKDQDIYDKLESEIGTGIDKKLEEMKISGVTTAFQRVDSSSKKSGRELLEAELAQKYGADEDELRQMSVIELIRYCRKHAEVKLEFSTISEKQWQEDFKKRNSSQKERKNQESDKTEKKAATVKPKTESNDKAEDKPSEKEENKNAEKGAASQGNEQNSASGSGTQQKNPISSSQSDQDPLSVTQPESSVQPQPEASAPTENPSQSENCEENGSNSEDDKHNKDNNGKGNENSGKDKNNKDNSNKDNNNKDNSNKNNGNKDKNNKDNSNKDKNNKDNSNKDKNNKDNSNRDKNNKDNSNKDKDNSNKDKDK